MLLNHAIWIARDRVREDPLKWDDPREAEEQIGKQFMHMYRQAFNGTPRCYCRACFFRSFTCICNNFNWTPDDTLYSSDSSSFSASLSD